MLAVTDSATTSSLSSPGRNNSSRRCMSDDLSVGSSSHGDSVLLSSPSSFYDGSSKKVTFVFDEKHMDKMPKCPSIPKKVLGRCYGNADISDRMGRTLSFLLLARIAVSFLLSTIDDEEL
mmetsp:Transcript_21859/g.44922  ORF Transcript_21859/g.44922 Transcript_21859/m.44922 type:complete len:120 (-) Transcript_21859:500-859(-)|eukprot:CAMPEP_0197270028 /NCGR_PEP_ID=MMETSP1432-20130617/6549_1 /TAXON_ID=44447 /ORGANISM="Pseudo-nitzschia delicatissima, Strain UNC1205" /LENGTH=119 /DNA_ID=CAMNT_0042735271 /DNA_START=94 /DNA_END=453 /DNA_ORIENTATION=+